MQCDWVRGVGSGVWVGRIWKIHAVPKLRQLRWDGWQVQGWEAPWATSATVKLHAGPDLVSKDWTTLSLVSWLQRNCSPWVEGLSSNPIYSQA